MLSRAAVHGLARGADHAGDHAEGAGDGLAAAPASIRSRLLKFVENFSEKCPHNVAGCREGASSFAFLFAVTPEKRALAAIACVIFKTSFTFA
jgi:hypothetical protein